ncbi:glutathione S-transferase theta-1-like [Mizuhopecten yessoensis]|uniref:Glutathione S-transferase theta-1 n=1 Tax=Mizuhopecten yessoensis TaxID=6573 RepID=A0A210R2M9_MIZYE|nr:glutathione S-transferase theta-1-like [Mizuhopecten yessoensis]OWF55350.1 Glutathione S-transferase theta-1 [Mizuhopecten yessoensis]
MVLTFYYDLLSQPCRAVYIFMKMNNIPFETKTINLLRGENSSEEFRKVSCIGRLPVIDDGGFILTECVAILKYLAVKHNVPDHWYPRTDLKAQARIDEYMNYQHISTRTNMAMLFQNLAIIPKTMSRPVDRKKVERFRNGVELAISHIDKYFLKDSRPYFAGDNISLADLVGICEMMQLYACCEERIIESNPNVKAWLERVKPNLAPYFDEASVRVWKLRENFIKTAPNHPKL